MSELQTIKRITVYADSRLSDDLVQRCLEMGSTGYTRTACEGKGEHGSVADPFENTQRYRIEFLVQPAVADKIMAHLYAHHLRSRSIAACIEDVKVFASEHF